MNPSVLRNLTITAVCVAAGVAIGGFVGGLDAAEPTEREIVITARQYAFDPPRIHINQGDRIRIKLVSKDVIHGFYLEGHDIDAEIRPQSTKFLVHHPQSGKPAEEVAEISFVANRRGKFRYRCSHTCGTLHPFMTGELLVAPNTPLHAGIGAMIGLFLGTLLTLWSRKEKRSAQPIIAEGMSS